MTYVQTSTVESHIQGLIDQENARHEGILKDLEALRTSFLGGAPASTSEGCEYTPNEPIHRELPTPSYHREPVRGGRRRGNGPSQRERVFRVISERWSTVDEISAATGLRKEAIAQLLSANRHDVQKRKRLDGYKEYHLTGVAQRQFAQAATTNGTAD